MNAQLIDKTLADAHEEEYKLFHAMQNELDAQKKQLDAIKDIHITLPEYHPNNDGTMTYRETNTNCSVHINFTEYQRAYKQLKELAPPPAPTPGDGYRWATEADKGKLVEASDDGMNWYPKYYIRKGHDCHICESVQSGNDYQWKYARRKIVHREITPTMEHVGKMVNCGADKSFPRKLITIFTCPRGSTWFITADNENKGWTYWAQAVTIVNENGEVVE
jgi:hypothetical protein